MSCTTHDTPATFHADECAECATILAAAMRDAVAAGILTDDEVADRLGELDAVTRSSAAPFVLVLAPYSYGGAWGKGATRWDALDACRRAGGELSRGWVALSWPAEPADWTVTDLGEVLYTLDAGEPERTESPR